MTVPPMFFPILHIVLHFLVPAAFAFFLASDRFRSYLVLISSMAVDLDHLLADPIYDASRCGIGFHPLHSYFALPFYLVLAVFPKTRIFGLGLVIHMALDYGECLRIGS